MPKVLALCIPRKAAQAFIDSGRSFLLAAQPNEESASFCYFDPTYSELEQFGPTFTCFGTAMTNVVTKNDKSTNFQSSSIKILALSDRRNLPTEQSSPRFKRAPLEASGQPSFGFEFGIALDHAVLADKPYTIRAAVRNTGERPVSFAKDLCDGIGQEVRPSVQGGAVPAITFVPPTGDWTMTHFNAGSRSQFAGIVLNPGEVFEFDFGSLGVPNAAVGASSRCQVIDLRITITDAITGTLLNIKGANFNFPTNVNQMPRFTVSEKAAQSELIFYPARVVETLLGELISGPVEGFSIPNSSLPVVDTSIGGGSPGVGIGPFR